MIAKSADTYTPVCDGCGEELAPEWDFMDAVNAVKAAGWRTMRPEGVHTNWEHYCPTCAARWDYGQ
jgi:hypothetical protein